MFCILWYIPTSTLHVGRSDVFNLNRFLSDLFVDNKFNPCHYNPVSDAIDVVKCRVTVLGIVISILHHVVNDISPHKTSSPSPGISSPANIHHIELWASRLGMKVWAQVTPYGKWTPTLNSILSFVALKYSFYQFFTANLNLIDPARCLLWWCQANCSLTLLSGSNVFSTNRDDYFCDSLMLNGSDILRMTRAPSCPWVTLGCTGIMTQCMPRIPAELHISPYCSTWCRLLVRILIKNFVSQNKLNSIPVFQRELYLMHFAIIICVVSSLMKRLLNVTITKLLWAI